MTRRLLALATMAVTAVLTTTLAAGSAFAVPATTDQPIHHTGTLPDGATWIADVPAHWRGTLVRYSHGFGTLAPADAPDPATQQALLDRGYALVGSSYDPNGSLWALASATRDQFAALTAIQRRIGPARLTLALGTSMGGLISAQEAQTAQHRLDGVVSTCGLVGGGIDLNNYQLDSEYALSRLLAPGQDIKLVNYASPGDGATAAIQLSTLATAARATPEGRARVALATALLDMPTWSASQPAPPSRRDADGWAAAQYEWLTGTLPFIMPARYFIELAAGGNASWNVGVNYAALLARSPYRYEVTTLYREAGLELNADLTNLTRHAAVPADLQAVHTLARTSTVTGHLDVPTLNLHTIYDQLAPVEYEHEYAHQVGAAGDGRLLRQAYVSRRGHCAFTPSELIAGLEAIAHRVTTGRWNTSTADLQAAAIATGLDDQPAFVDFQPGPFVSHRTLGPAH
jgi:hypothetical protein